MPTTLMDSSSREAADGIDAPRSSARTPHPGPPALRVRGLVKRYKDGTSANRGIDLDVGRGEIVAVLGPNGAGKTTFLRQVTTELRPTSGAIAIFGIDAMADPQRAKQLMGITPQEAGVFESLTVREHLGLFGRLKGLTKHASVTAAAALIDELDLGAQAGKAVGSLSGGQRRRVLIGLALLGRPPLLVLDEPTTGLDPASRRSVWQVLRRAALEGGSVVLSTHSIEEAERLSDRIAIITAGNVIAFGTIAELLSRSHASYRLSYHDPSDLSALSRMRRYATFAEAKAQAERLWLSEYTIARVSLEDVYFTLAGETLPTGDLEKAIP